jgi:hypothetical protein
MTAEKALGTSSLQRTRNVPPGFVRTAAVHLKKPNNAPDPCGTINAQQGMVWHVFC